MIIARSAYVLAHDLDGLLCQMYTIWVSFCHFCTRFQTLSYSTSIIITRNCFLVPVSATRYSNASPQVPTDRPSCRCGGRSHGSPVSSGRPRSTSGGNTWSPTQAAAANSSPSSSGGSARASGSGWLGSLPGVFFSLSNSGLALSLQSLFSSFRRLLLENCFVLHVGHVLRRSLPVRVENQSLVVLGLRQNSRPSIK